MNNNLPETYDQNPFDPYVRLYVETIDGRDIYHLEAMFRLESSGINRAVVMEAITDPTSRDTIGIDYHVGFLLEAGTVSDPMISVVLTDPPADGKGRIAVTGRGEFVGDGHGHEPKGDGKTIIRFEDAVRH